MVVSHHVPITEEIPSQRLAEATACPDPKHKGVKGGDCRECCGVLFSDCLELDRENHLEVKMSLILKSDFKSLILSIPMNPGQETDPCI